MFHRLGSIVSLALASLVWSGAAPADLLKVRTSCAGEAPSGSCFTTLAGAISKINEVPRLPPSESNPVVVDIGPGIFNLNLANLPTDENDMPIPWCREQSNLTFRGAGTLSTFITGGGYPGVSMFYIPALPDVFQAYVVRIDDCSEVYFEDLTIYANQQAAPYVGAGAKVKSAVRFVGNGSTHWDGVELLGSGGLSSAFVDGGPAGVGSSTHFWADSYLYSTYTALWSENGRHLMTDSMVEVSASGTMYGTVYGNSDFDITLVDTAVVATNTSPIYPTIGVLGNSGAGDCENGRITLLRGSITANGASPAGISSGCGPVFALDVEYDLTATAGSAARIGGAATFAPVNDVGTGANPGTQQMNALWSKTNEDLFFETDCSATRCSGSSEGPETHLLRFDTGCSTAGPWFDTHTAVCRGVTP
jgi:hypothetical protein